MIDFPDRSAASGDLPCTNAVSEHATRRSHTIARDAQPATPHHSASDGRPHAGAPPGHPSDLPVLIIDDDAAVGRALERTLRAAGLNAVFRPVRTHSGELAAPPLVRKGIALLDLDLGHDQHGRPLDGTDLIAPLHAAGWRVLLLTDSPRCGHDPASTNDARLGAAMAAGRLGRVRKSDPLAGVLAALTDDRGWL